MLRVIWKYEWKQWALRPAFLTGVLFLAVLLGYALYYGKLATDAHSAQVAEALAEEERGFALKKARLDSLNRGILGEVPSYESPDNPLVAGQFQGSGRSAGRFPGPLGAVALGQTDVHPALVKANVTGNSEVVSLRNPAHQNMGPFDANFALVFFLPLFVLAFSYNLVSAERESGALQLLSAQTASFWRIFIWKLVFRWLLLTAAVWLALGASMAIWGIPVLSTPTLWLFGGVALYSLFWFTLAIWVNFLGKNSSFNAIALLGCWLLFVLVIPQLATALASAIHPAPSRATMVNELRALDRQLEAEKKALLDAWYRNHPEVVRKPESEMEWEDYWREDFLFAAYSDSLQQRIRNRYDQSAQTLQALTSRLRFASPASLLYDFVTELSGTHARQTQDFAVQRTAFQQAYAAFFREKFLNGEKMTLADYDQIPAFNPDPGTGYPRSGNLAGILVFCGAALAFTAAGLRRREGIGHTLGV